MVSFPEWVPEDVVQFYEKLEAQEEIDGFTNVIDQTNPFGIRYYDSHHYTNGLATLRLVMESIEMQKAWEALDKRRSEQSPMVLAYLLALVIPDNVDAAIEFNESQNAAKKRLVNDIQKAIAKYKASTDDDIPSGLDKAMSHLNLLIEQQDEYWDNEMGVYAKQRGASNAARHYLVRRLAEMFEGMYGTPLHETVASLANVLLDDQGIDADLVKKAVKSNPNSAAG